MFRPAAIYRWTAARPTDHRLFKPVLHV